MWLCVILFLVDNCVLLLLFHVIYVIVVFLVIMVAFCALEFACCIGDAERSEGKWW